MAETTPLKHTSVALAQLRPTQISVGMLQVEHKRERLQELEKRPTELMTFILEHPVRVVWGPKGDAYVIDHHHLALALTKEKFVTAPMEIEADFSSLPMKTFWKEMQAQKFVYPFDAHGKKRTIAQIPKSLKRLEDDPYRSLAGFVREAGGFHKVATPYAEFLWANYFRTRIAEKLVRKHFNKALKQAMLLASDSEARFLPGFLKASRR